jgi:hypothetical protein
MHGMLWRFDKHATFAQKFEVAAKKSFLKILHVYTSVFGVLLQLSPHTLTEYSRRSSKSRQHELTQ